MPSILPVVRLGLPDLGILAQRAERAAAAQPPGGTTGAGGSPGQQGKGSSVSASHHAALGGFAGLTIFLGLPLGRILVVIASVALAAVVGCRGLAPDSASAACKDFTTWYREHGGKILAGKDMALLRRAVSEAPSGRLSDDLHKLELDIDSHRNFMQTNSAPKDAIVGSDAAQVAADCKSVNPG